MHVGKDKFGLQNIVVIMSVGSVSMLPGSASTLCGSAGTLRLLIEADHFRCPSNGRKTYSSRTLNCMVNVVTVFFS
jgi:hypothetical protein